MSGNSGSNKLMTVKHVMHSPDDAIDVHEVSGDFVCEPCVELEFVLWDSDDGTR